MKLKLINGQFKARIHPDTLETIAFGVVYMLATIGGLMLGYACLIYMGVM